MRIAVVVAVAVAVAVRVWMNRGLGRRGVPYACPDAHQHSLTQARAGVGERDMTDTKTRSVSEPGETYCYLGTLAAARDTQF